MKKVLVAGGSGFIGSHLCRVLVGRGHDVICLDNMFTGRKKNIFDLLSAPNFQFKRADVTERLRISVDEIYNLACPASPVHYQLSPVATVKANVHGTLNLLELARTTGARFLQASTSEVYGDPEEHPQTETYWGRVNPIGPRSCYDEGKRCAETLCFDFGREFSVDARVARIFNTYGPCMSLDDGRVVSNFIVQALRKENLTIYGGGLQTRSFCFVDDLVKGLILLMDAESEVCGPVNLGNPREITVLELASIITSLVGGQLQIDSCPLPQDDPRQRQPCISKAQKVLGWQPETALEVGLEKTIDYFRAEVSR